jgi:hypothetical protein
MLALKGNYLLKVNFGDADVAVDVNNIKEFTIVQDLKKFLPEFHIRLIDAQGILTHLVPFGQTLTKIKVQIGESYQSPVINSFDFQVFRRQPEGAFGSGAIYDIRGLLSITKLFSPSFCRTFTGTIASTIQSIATEMGILKTDISANLNYAKTLIQPNISNAQFLDWIERSVVGVDDDGGYNLFVSQRNGVSTLNCKTYKDLNLGPLCYKFLINDEPVEDYYPATLLGIEDNYMFYGVFGAKKQSAGYFNYTTSEWVDEEYSCSDFTSLTDFFAIDGSDSEDSESMNSMGTSNEFSSNFRGHVLGNYYSRLEGLSRMSILTWGVPNICPGDVVKVLFAHGQRAGTLQSFQFSGYWVVEKAVHSITNTHRTRLFLMRNGMDTDKDSTLVRAVNQRR